MGEFRNNSISGKGNYREKEGYVNVNYSISSNPNMKNHF